MTKDPSVRHRSLDISPTEGKPKEKRPAKERSKADDSMIRRNTLRTRQYEHEFGLNREKTPQVSEGYISYRFTVPSHTQIRYQYSVQSRPRLCVIDAVNYILTQNEIVVVSY